MRAEMREARLRPLCAANLPAYLAVVAAWLAVSAVMALIMIRALSGGVAPMRAFCVALVAVMSGMAIMFVSSLLNLRKLRGGFERLARGERDPRIPPVWCPVLTSAAQSATQLARRLDTQAKNEG